MEITSCAPTRKRHLRDPTAIQWDISEHLFPRPMACKYPLLENVTAVHLLAKGYSSWWILPHDFPPRKTVSCYFYF